MLPAVSTSSQAFAAILDDLVRAVDAPDLNLPDLNLPGPGAPAPTAPGPAAPGPAAPGPTPKGTSSSPPEAEGDDDVPLEAQITREPETRGAAVGGAVLLRAAPPRLRGKGDLTLVVGLGPDARAAAAILAASADADVLPVADRREALAARAEGVRRECPIVGVVELPRVDAVPGLAASLAAIAPDQVWAAVDVGRKLDDTALWVRAVDAVLAVDGIAAHGAALTASPWAVGALGLPLLWLDAPPG